MCGPVRQPSLLQAIGYSNRLYSDITDYTTRVAAPLLCDVHTSYSCLKPNSSIVKMFESLPALAPAVMYDPQFTAPLEAPLKMDFVMQQIQEQLLGGQQDMAVLVDTGDSMFR